MKRALKWGGTALAVIGAALAAFAIYVEVDGVPRFAPPPKDDRAAVATPESVAHGEKLATLLCAGCHENKDTHRFTGTAMDDLPPEFGEIYSKNITQHPAQGIGAWTDGELRTFLRTGLMPSGQYVPPYMPKLPHTSDEELDALIAFLRSDDPRVAASDVSPPGVSKPSFLVKALSHTVFEPLPKPTKPVVAPARSDRVAYGRYLVVSLDCYACHSADFTKMNVLEPEKSAGYLGGGNAFKRPDGATIHSANLTADAETGIGRWTESDFVRALRKGFRPDGTVLSYPMDPRPELDDEEAAAIYAYLRTVPKIAKANRRPSPSRSAVAGGKAVYERYGCNSCHGDDGKGAVGDLRRANANFPTDAELRRWIDEAPAIRPSTRMPGWKGVIKEEDYGPLLAHVRELAGGGKAAMNP